MPKRLDKSRGPTFNQIVAAGKAAGPRATENPASTMDLQPVWCLKRLIIGERGHRWTSMDDEKERVNVYSALKSYSHMKWKEIRSRKSCHASEVAEIDRPLRDVIQRHCPDVESVFQLRVDGAGRVWGIVIGATFQVLLWDPEHEGHKVVVKNT